MDNFNLEDRYQQYLKLCGLSESNMNPIQRTETRRAFYGGCGMMFVIMGTDIGEFDDDDEGLYKTLESLEEQITKFWSLATDKNKSKLI